MNFTDIFLHLKGDQPGVPLTPWAWTARHGPLVEEPSPGLFRLTEAGAVFLLTLLLREHCFSDELLERIEHMAADGRLRANPAAAAMAYTGALREWVDSANLAAATGWLERESRKPADTRRADVSALMRLMQLALEEQAKRRVS